MGRPRKEPGSVSAKQRIEEAFWQLLEESPETPITVRALAQRAKVNHNTFYYHYSCIEDLAIDLVGEHLTPEMKGLFRAAVIDGMLDLDAIPENGKLSDGFTKLKLILNSSNAELVRLGREHIAALFLETLGLKAEQLEDTDRAKMSFVFGGLISLISFEEIRTFDDYRAVLQDGVAEFVIEMWRSIIQKKTS